MLQCRCCMVKFRIHFRLKNGRLFLEKTILFPFDTRIPHLPLRYLFSISRRLYPSLTPSSTLLSRPVPLPLPPTNKTIKQYSTPTPTPAPTASSRLYGGPSIALSQPRESMSRRWIGCDVEALGGGGCWEEGRRRDGGGHFELCFEGTCAVILVYGGWENVE